MNTEKQKTNFHLNDNCKLTTKNELPPDNEHNASLIHQNLQSIGNSINGLELMLREHSTCSMLCVTEHWKTEEQLKQHQIREFNLVTSFCRRRESAHGGSAIFLRRDYKYKKKVKINLLSVENHFECCGCEVKMKKGNIILVCIYRPPSSNFKEYIKTFDKLLEFCFCEKKTVVIAGDFNVDFLSRNNDALDMLSLIRSYNFKAVVQENTRITCSSKTCIDNIITNLQCSVKVEILQYHISDHTAQKMSFTVEKSMAKTTHSDRRSFSENNKQTFKQLLNTQKFETVYAIDNSDVNSQWDAFLKIVHNYFSQCFPLKRIPYRNFKKTKYMQNDPDVATCKRELDTLYRLKNCHDKFRAKYAEKKKQYDTLLKNKKMEYYNEKIKSSNNRSKACWRAVSEISGKQGKNDKQVINEYNNLEMAEEFNNFFLNASSVLLCNLPDVPFSASAEKGCQETISLDSVDNKEILNIVSNLKNKNSCGHDDISNVIIKYVITTIVRPLVHIVNNSMRCGIFPNQLKLAIIVPIHKKDTTQQLENYRPISLLTSFSKIFERVMTDRLSNYLVSNGLLNGFQHGYVKGRSTQTAIFQFIEKILTSLENKEIPVGIYLDLTKAYDTINHEILLKKLRLLGVHGVANKWLLSYLTGRQQQVAIGVGQHRVVSSKIEVSLGIPQGSILGPLLFVIYINDITDLLSGADEKLHITNYADDTNLLLLGTNINSVFSLANEVMQKAHHWFSKHKMSLNNSKTKVMVFQASRSAIDRPQEITLGDANFEIEQKTKFLGMILDSSLSWQPHVDSIVSKLHTICYSMRVLTGYLSLQTKKMIYHANFESRIRYGIIFYGQSTDIGRVFVCQKRVLRIILQMKVNETCRGKFKTNNLMTVHAIYIQECILYFFKNKLTFQQHMPQNNYVTRNLEYSFPRHRLTLYEHGPYYNAIKCYNKLPRDIKLITQLKPFKTAVYKFLVHLEPYSLKEYLD